FLTELTSNTATTEMALPILGSVSTAIHLHPLLLMIPATLSASCAFMLPVATPPNAIIFGTQRLTISQMAKVGIILNLFGVVLITLGVYFFATAVLNIDISQFPAWAMNH
ncbi:anion permease, partial [Candidatus Sumerlaeota bacterium]|nr:anion permease [Candidatus Sumerlaeota bacterium]